MAVPPIDECYEIKHGASRFRACTGPTERRRGHGGGGRINGIANRRRGEKFYYFIWKLFTPPALATYWTVSITRRWSELRPYPSLWLPFGLYIAADDIIKCKNYRRRVFFAPGIDSLNRHLIQLLNLAVAINYVLSKFCSRLQLFLFCDATLDGVKT